MAILPVLVKECILFHAVFPLPPPLPFTIQDPPFFFIAGQQILLPFILTPPFPRPNDGRSEMPPKNVFCSRGDWD